MRASEIMNLIECAFASGRIDSQVETGVRAEYVRRAEAEAMLATRGITKSTLAAWVRDGLVNEVSGVSKNSPRKYSVKEISKAILAINIKKII